MHTNAAVDILRSKDRKAILSLLEIMCVSLSRDMEIFEHAQKSYKETSGNEDKYLNANLEKMRTMLLVLILLKSNIFLLTKSPL